MKKQLTRILKIFIALAGGILCVRLVISIGWRGIVAAFQTHWLALLLLTCVYLVYHILRTWTLQICIPQKTRFWNLFGVRLAGEAVAYIAVGSIVGDSLKVALGREKIPVIEGATGVFAEKLIYHFSGALFIIGGLFVGLLYFGIGGPLLYAIGIMILMFVGFLFLLSSGIRPIARILHGIKVRKPKLREAVLKTEESLSLFRKEHPTEFLLTFLIDLVSYFYSIAEVFFILNVLLVHPSFWDLWYYQAVVKMSNGAMIVIPANLGLFEATNVLLAKQLQMGEQAGIIVALFIRIRSTLWALFGYLWFLYLIGQQKNSEKTPL